MKIFKLTNEICEKTLDELPPQTGKVKIDKIIEPGKWFLSRHFIERLNERLLENILFEDKPLLVKIAIELKLKMESYYYKTSSKKTHKTLYMIDTYLGNIPVLIVLSHYPLKKQYTITTLYVRATAEVANKVIYMYEQNQQDKAFFKKIHEQFFNNITEEQLFDTLQLVKKEKVKIINVTKFIKDKSKKYLTNMEQIDINELEDEISNIEIIEEIEDNPYTHEIEEKTSLGLGLTTDDFPWD